MLAFVPYNMWSHNFFWQQLLEVSVYFYTVCALVKIEKQNNKNTFLKDVFTARTVPRIFDYIYRITPCVSLPVCICVIIASVSLSRRAGDGARPIINTQSCARSFRQLCIWAGQGQPKTSFCCEHTLRTLPAPQ